MCCNRPRTATSPQARPAVPVSPQPAIPAAVPVRGAFAPPHPVFEYAGPTALTVVSPITRKTYRFEHTGARLQVDPRDRSWLAFVPNLKHVS